MIRLCPHFQAVKDISPQADEYDRVQDQAAAVLFLVVTGNSLWDRRYDVGPRVRTLTEVNREVLMLNELAASHESNASKHEQLGDWHATRELRAIAAECRAQSGRRRPNLRNPWIVERKSSRWGDDWDRGLVPRVFQNAG